VEEDISGLCEGWYSVTITDAFGNTTVNGNYIAEDCYCDLWGWVDQTPIGCNNPGSAHVDGFGGTPPYTFQWQNANGQTISTAQTFVTTVPGTYTVIITDSGTGNNQCTFDQTVVFTN